MSNTNTEVLTTAYENLQKAITQANTVLPPLQEAIEKGNLDNYATTSDLEEKASKTDVKAANDRIDAFTTLGEGSTTGDAELIDGRIGADGTTYSNIGGAIRGQVNGINTDLGNINDILFVASIVEPTYVADNIGYYQQGTIVTSNNSDTYSAKFFDVTNMKYAFLTFDTNDRSSEFKFVLFTDNTNNYIGYDLATSTATNYVNKKVNVPTGATRMIVNYLTSGTPLVVKKHISKIDTYATKNEIKSIKNNISLLNSIDKENPLEVIDKTGGYANIFRKVGIIGDSLSSGAQDTEGGNNAFDYWEHSWAKYMSRTTGCELVKLCKGGLQCANWHEVFETTALNENNKCDCYIMFIGHNDALSGDISDVDVDNLLNSNTDTMYGRYARIIGTLRTASPGAKIFCVTYPIVYVERSNKNKLIREVAEKLNCYLIDLWEYDVNKKEFKENWEQTSFGSPEVYKAKIHYTPLGYLKWSWEIMSYIDYIIRHNVQDFTDVGYINTGHTFD